MTHLRKMMLEELERRNYAQTTIHSYLRSVAEFSLHFHRPPNQLGPDHIRQYQAHLFGQRKLAPSTVTQRLAALRFFYIKTLRKPWSVTETPYPKKVQRLPIILSTEEVAQLIDSALTAFHRILLMTLYATGVRRAELARLKITDIDSRRMIIHIQGGKGRKDRDVMLSPTLLQALREYWRGLRRKPTDWLFPGGRWHTANHPITPKVVWNACEKAAQRAGIHKKIHPHILVPNTLGRIKDVLVTVRGRVDGQNAVGHRAYAPAVAIVDQPVGVRHAVKVQNDRLLRFSRNVDCLACAGIHIDLG
jgi:integrase/recombinase XerD